MNKLLGFTTLALTFALSGCGGDSDSSGSKYNQSFPSNLTNGNIYQCPSEEAKQVCRTDASCAIAKCNITKEVTPLPNGGQTGLKACKVNGKFVTGYLNETCKFKNTVVDADLEVTCQSGIMTLNGHIGNFKTTNSKYTNGSTNINTFNITCP